MGLFAANGGCQAQKSNHGEGKPKRDYSLTKFGYLWLAAELFFPKRYGRVALAALKLAIQGITLQLATHSTLPCRLEAIYYAFRFCRSRARSRAK
jgi:hypothetical protein